MSIGIALLGLQLACGICCFWLSGEKNRSAWWFFVGLIFGVIGLLTLVGAPVLERKTKDHEGEQPKSDIRKVIGQLR